MPNFVLSQGVLPCTSAYSPCRDLSPGTPRYPRRVTAGALARSPSRRAGNVPFAETVTPHTGEAAYRTLGIQQQQSQTQGGSAPERADPPWHNCGHGRRGSGVWLLWRCAARGRRVRAGSGDLGPIARGGSGRVDLSELSTPVCPFDREQTRRAVVVSSTAARRLIEPIERIGSAVTTPDRRQGSRS